MFYIISDEYISWESKRDIINFLYDNGFQTIHDESVKT